jgi:hypothetical protein
MNERGRNILKEGAISGIIGATGVAVWFLIVDTVQGRPFFTPAYLGDLLQSMLDPKAASEAKWVNVMSYTGFHYAAFLIFGTIASLVVHQAERFPSVLAGFLILFVAFEIGFHGLVALLQETTVLHELAWYQVMAGNLIAAGLMGTYLWRRHPALREELIHALDGTAE